MPQLVFCLDCGECLGEDKENVAKEHLKKFPDHTNYLTKNIVDPFSMNIVDEWINQKLTSQQNNHRFDRTCFIVISNWLKHYSQN